MKLMNRRKSGSVGRVNDKRDLTEVSFGVDIHESIGVWENRNCLLLTV